MQSRRLQKKRKQKASNASTPHLSASPMSLNSLPTPESPKVSPAFSLPLEYPLPCTPPLIPHPQQGTPNLWQAALSAFQNQAFERSVELFEKLLDLYSSYATTSESCTPLYLDLSRIHFNIARLKAFLGEHHLAILYFDDATEYAEVATDGDHTQGQIETIISYYAIGLVNFQLREFRAASQAWHSASALMDERDESPSGHARSRTGKRKVRAQIELECFPLRGLDFEDEGVVEARKWILKRTQIDLNARAAKREGWYTGRYVTNPDSEQSEINGLPVGVLFGPPDHDEWIDYEQDEGKMVAKTRGSLGSQPEARSYLEQEDSRKGQMLAVSYYETKELPPLPLPTPIQTEHVHERSSPRSSSADSLEVAGCAPYKIIPWRQNQTPIRNTTRTINTKKARLESHNIPYNQFPPPKSKPKPESIFDPNFRIVPSSRTTQSSDTDIDIDIDPFTLTSIPPSNDHEIPPPAITLPRSKSCSKFRSKFNSHHQHIHGPRHRHHTHAPTVPVPVPVPVPFPLPPGPAPERAKKIQFGVDERLFLFPTSRKESVMSADSFRTRSVSTLCSSDLFFVPVLMGEGGDGGDGEGG
ncbi:hypothetical protein MMC09_003145 [Bachmanniomyces sp. S44760]|nr:hypothetical protein [Bachmanniomyces sp. S44760]